MTIIKRLEDGLLVMLYGNDPDDLGEELITPSDDISQDEHYPKYAHLKPGESMVIERSSVKYTSASYYPSQYEDLDEFLNMNPSAIDFLADLSED
jgi:hypothetical protein